MYIEETLMKLKVCFFELKVMNYYKDIMKFEKKFKIVSKKTFVPVYNGKYLKTKIKSYNENINTNHHNNKILILLFIGNFD